MAEDALVDFKSRVNVLEEITEKLTCLVEECRLEIAEVRRRTENLEAWQRQTQGVHELADNAGETSEDCARKLDVSANGKTELNSLVVEDSHKFEAGEVVPHVLTDTEFLAEESKADLQGTSLQQLEAESRCLKVSVQDDGKSEHLPMEEKEKIEESNTEEKECTEIEVLVELDESAQPSSKGSKSEVAFGQGSHQLSRDSIQEADGNLDKINDTDEPKETQDEYVEGLSESAIEHEDRVPEGEGLVAEDIKFKPDENGQKDFNRSSEGIDGRDESTTEPIHFAGDDLLQFDLSGESTGTTENEDHDDEFDIAVMEKFFNYINLNTSDELEIAFSEDARKQEESMENHVIETLELIIMHIEQEINANLPVSLRECLHICLRKLAESTHTLQELRVHELETELRLQTRSLRDHKIEILRMYNALSRKFWEEYAFKEQLYKAQEELNEEFLLRRKYEDMSLEFGRASDDVTLNIENHMKKHTQLSQSYEKLKIDYGKLVIKYNKIAKSEGECDEDRVQVVTGAQYNEGETEDELPITLSNLQMIMLLDSLKELKEVASNPSLTQPRGRKLMVETIERNKALDHGRRDLVAYVSTNPHLRCEKLEKVLTAYKKRYDYFWKGVFMDLTLSMFDATGNGCPLMTDLFLEYGERCSIVDKYQNTPLHYAAKRGNVIVGRTLIKAGSIVNHVNVAKITPLHLSLFYGHINFSLLLAHNGANLNLRDVFMNTPLHLATLTSNFVCMKMLLDKNVEVNAVDVDGDTPFLNCAITGNYELGSMLLGAGADITARNHVGSTAMHLAAWQGNMMFCKFLVDKLFPVGPINLHNVTPLHLAAMEGYTSLVELLIKSGATVNAVEDKTDSPLHYAAKLGNGEMAQALLTAGADVLARNFFEWTPLHSAASRGYSKVCLMLLIAESDINAVDAKKRTPLHLAVLSDDVSAVQLLVKRGADLKAVDCDQKTPCQLGYELEKLDIAIWLEEQAFSLYSKERKKKSREGRRGTPGSQS